MNYKGKELKTYPEIIDYALKLKGAEQRAFVSAYAKTGKHALSNVGYFAGYYDSKKAQRIYEVFSTKHPIFGTGTPTPETALRAGKMMAKQYLKRKSRSA